MAKCKALTGSAAKGLSSASRLYFVQVIPTIDDQVHGMESLRGFVLQQCFLVVSGFHCIRACVHWCTWSREFCIDLYL